MKFKVLHDFKSPSLYEAGNSHDSAKIGVSDAEVECWYRQGWVQIEGRDAAPALDPKRTELVVESTKHTTKSPEVK